MRFAPPIHPSLIGLVAELDDGTRTIAEVWRQLGRRARARKLFQPSYESVRRLVHAQREARRVAAVRARRAAVLALGLLFNPLSRKQMLLHAGAATVVDRRRVYYGRRL